MQKRPRLPATLQTSQLIHKDASVSLEDGVLRVSRPEMALRIKGINGDLFLASGFGSGPVIELQFSGENLGFFEQSYGRDGHINESHIRHLSLRGLYCERGLEISISADTAPTQAYGYNRKSAGLIIDNGINIFCQFSVPARKLSSFFEGQDFLSDPRTADCSWHTPRPC